MDINKIYKYYKRVNSLRKTASKFKISRTKLTSLLNKNGLVINKSNREKYDIDLNYFKVIDTEEKAYWLGFIFADGYVDEKSYTVAIELKRSDKKQLYKLKKSIKSEHNVKDRVDKNTSYFRFCNKNIVDDLTQYGLGKPKSLNLKFPNNIPDSMKVDFIRGYFDGDGSLYTLGKRNVGVGIIGTKELLDSFKDILSSINNYKNLKIRPSVKSKPEYNVYRLETTNVGDSMKLVNLLYNKCNIYLDRKYEKYLSIQERTSTTTIDQPKLVKNKVMV